MKLIVAFIACVLCGLSFHAGVMYERGTLTPAVEARLRAAVDHVKGWFK